MEWVDEESDYERSQTVFERNLCMIFANGVVIIDEYKLIIKKNDYQEKF